MLTSVDTSPTLVYMTSTDTLTRDGFMVRRSTKTASSPSVWRWIVRTTDGTFAGQVYDTSASAAIAQWKELNVDD